MTAPWEDFNPMKCTVSVAVAALSAAIAMQPIQEARARARAPAKHTLKRGRRCEAEQAAGMVMSHPFFEVM